MRDLLDANARLRPVPYAKWRGAHWVLLALSELGYPPADPLLGPLRDAVLDQWLAERYRREKDVDGVQPGEHETAVPRIRGRARRCASQQAGALLSITRLKFDDGRGPQLVELLRRWQWPDGGWNCDRTPTTVMSSVNETLLPIRALAAYGTASGDSAATEMAQRACDVLLDRHVAFRRSNGAPLTKDVMQLHYPLYWHYDVLGGLVGLAEAGMIGDARCARALDVLESRRLPDRGWPADATYGPKAETGYNVDAVDWGPIGNRTANPWVTINALYVLRAAGR
ncbi:hypothetical protein G3T36_03950 [Diaminobutyricibacter tongyongensis]|uniref:Squalene cyclase C-terminal domain-containing protein n=1 Tax=Leifsonia tongyongensis TaxID=1268043 RepID=A0A6L9XUV4_9MICO|nr:hypothetical protein [Diaminobutyricibacter tongyongensis]NEN05017.1 hypothetical protein [Diaminobutyricibacter tongyongensis]